MALNLGPWAIPVAVVALILGVVVAEGTASLLARRGWADAGNGVWIALLVALVVARAVFVAKFWPSYRLHPIGILDVRDLGFSVVGGVIALVLVVALLAWRRRRWRRALPVSTAAGLGIWALVGFTASQLQRGSHPPLPQLTLHTLNGKTVDVASLAGKPMVINLWATWCPPCRRELPMLVAAQKARHKLRFVFADQGESAARVEHFLQAEGLSPHHVLLDGNRQLSRYYRAPGYPTTVFVGVRGRMREIHVGPLSRATLVERLQQLSSLPIHGSGGTP